MTTVQHEDGLPELSDPVHYGIEIKEVDFKEFDRRKAPRQNNYEAFIAALEFVPKERLSKESSSNNLEMAI